MLSPLYTDTQLGVTSGPVQTWYVTSITQTTFQGSLRCTSQNYFKRCECKWACPESHWRTAYSANVIWPSTVSLWAKSVFTLLIYTDLFVKIKQFVSTNWQTTKYVVVYHFYKSWGLLTLFFLMKCCVLWNVFCEMFSFVVFWPSESHCNIHQLTNSTTDSQKQLTHKMDCDFQLILHLFSRSETVMLYSGWGYTIVA